MQLVPLIGQVEERFLWVEEEIKMLTHICRRKGVKKLQKKNLDTSLVFSTALKILEAKGSCSLCPSFRTHNTTVAKVSLV